MKYVDIKVAESSNGKNIIQSTIKKALTFVRAFSDLDRIQTCNLLSRNQMRYSVAPRGHCCFCFTGAKVRPFLKPANFLTTFSQIIFFLLYLYSPAEGVFRLVILNVKYSLFDFIGI